VGQSSGLIIRRSLVRVQPAPPAKGLVRTLFRADGKALRAEVSRMCPASDTSFPQRLHKSLHKGALFFWPTFPVLGWGIGVAAQA
jgi:hypothetical protein